MYSQSDIQDAVAGGALSAEQAAGLRNYVATRNGVPTPDEEYVRIVLGFNDIFVFITCGVVLFAVGWVGTLIPFDAPVMRQLPTSSPFAALLVTVASWGLAEVFTRQRHMALPSILLVISFIWGVFFTLVLMLFAAIGPASLGQEGAAILMAACCALAAGAAWLHYKRFRVPITVAGGVGFAILALVSVIGISLAGSRSGGDVMQIVMLVAGLATFLYAMWWDEKDLRRETTRSDVAFWLHWLGAALIVQALTMLFGLSNGIGSVVGAIGVLVAYVLFAFLALAIDRRIILIAGLTPLLLAIRSLLNEGSSGRMGMGYDRYGSASPDAYGGGMSGSEFGGSADSMGGGMGGGMGGMSGSEFGSNPYANNMEGTMITVIILGLVLLLLAIFWTQLRRMVVAMLPQGLRAKVPATTQQAATEAQTFE